MQARLPDPGDPITFVRSKLDLSDDRVMPEEYALHRDLLRMRKRGFGFSKAAGPARHGGRSSRAGGVLWSDSSVISRADDRLLIVNLGRDLNLTPAPEPLLAPPETEVDRDWTSEDPRYGLGYSSG